MNDFNYAEQAAENQADAYEAALEPVKVSLPEKRPAELTTFVIGTIGVGASLGLNLSEGVIMAYLAVITCLPAVVTYIINLYRESIHLEDVDD